MLLVPAFKKILSLSLALLTILLLIISQIVRVSEVCDQIQIVIDDHCNDGNHINGIIELTEKRIGVIQLFL